MENKYLTTIQTENLEDAITYLKQCFNLKFEKYELFHLQDLDQLSNHIIDKINKENSTDCTNQQAFYKIRKALQLSVGSKAKQLTPNSKLEDIIPRKNRKKQIKLLENQLGFKLKILTPKNYLANLSISAIILSMGFFYFDWKIGLLGFMLSKIFMDIVFSSGREYQYQTVRELIESTIYENYINFRRNKSTINKSELKLMLNKMFCEALDMNQEELNSIRIN